jgi:tetratricopeptide (TPR) repeat protein
MWPGDDQTGVLRDIDHKRKALAPRPKGHPDRGQRASELGEMLCTGYRQIGDVALIHEGIQVQREALALHTQSHPDRARHCSDLGVSLYNHYKQAQDTVILAEALELQRKALALRPPDHPDRALDCNNLGGLLRARYEQCGDLTLLNESIELHREALALWPPGHPDRALGCRNIGSSLQDYYLQCGDLTLRDEALELKREALALQPPGHPDRALSCNDLSAALYECYQQCDDLTLLDEALELQHEAVALTPPGHPDRAFSCRNLGALLHARHAQYGDLALLDEAIELKGEALALQPLGHPEYAANCGSLAASLHARYRQCGDLTLLDEASKLKREALALQPPGHPDRALSCNNLATTLHERYEQCGDLALLNEVIELKREALALRPPGHSKRSISCNQLSYSLLDYYKWTKDTALLDEVIELCGYTLEHDTSSMKLRSSVILSELHLIPDTSHFSTIKALHYLDVSLGSEVDNIRDLIRNSSYSLSKFWSLPVVWTTEMTLLLSNIYAKIIDRLPLAVGFVLDTPSRLQILKFRHHLGTDGCVAAVLASQPSTAVELLDRAHGLIWTQALHQRDPQMEGAPPELASELAGLLREIAAPLPAQLDDLSYASRQDSRHRQNTRIQALLCEIRAKPGLERFMLGRTYDTLREAACDHPIVVLAEGRGHAFALIMSSATEDQPHALGLDLTSDDIQSLQSAAQEAGLRSSADTREEDAVDSRIGYKTSGLHVHHKPFRVLAKIWHKIVKPVLDHLKLDVCTLITLTFAS